MGRKVLDVFQGFLIEHEGILFGLLGSIVKLFDPFIANKILQPIPKVFVVVKESSRLFS